MICSVCPSTAVSYDPSAEMYTCQTCGYSWFDSDDFDDLVEDDDFDVEFDCGFQPGSGCLYAGSEDCDWECPYRDELHRHPDYPNVSLSDF
ncbi:hypothetical protein NIES4075_44500 [Tolypothrix sp. NIES-4075]|uniref:hypothetical protein n=1 Tax=Tolypothrix sp. NIES-4075 TaxID=2005459 RepID=UPI000B5CCF79|nr:hypothetical protein [Tolypothrix sp. NIES-4075]GAX43437.1 hypothetical protein NIES4075_44500 [Tolypothrix sp. NIES-4075]